jgi:3-carboxy-cis,cis-muconate cycloisomerase
MMMAAAPKLGRQRAHDAVYGVCRKAIESGRQLAGILVDVPEVAVALGGVDAIRHYCDPINYLGLCGQSAGCPVLPALEAQKSESVASGGC